MIPIQSDTFDTVYNSNTQAYNISQAIITHSHLFYFVFYNNNRSIWQTNRDKVKCMTCTTLYLYELLQQVYNYISGICSYYHFHIYLFYMKCLYKIKDTQLLTHHVARLFPDQNHPSHTRYPRSMHVHIPRLKQLCKKSPGHLAG